METDVKEPKPATAVKAKPSKPGAPLQRTLIALARAPKDAKNADEERHYLLIGYAVAVEEALAEARRRLGDLQLIIRDTARWDWRKRLEQEAAGDREISERGARESSGFRGRGQPRRSETCPNRRPRLPGLRREAHGHP